MADFQVKRRAFEGTGVTYDRDRRVFLDWIAFFDQEFRTMPVEGVVRHAVIHNDKISVALNVIRVDDHPGMNAFDNRAA